MPGRHLALVCAYAIVGFLCAAEALAGTQPIWNPGLEQAATGRLGRGAPPKSIEELRRSVQGYLWLTDEQLRYMISGEKGGARDEKGIRERAQATYNLALLHHLTKRNPSNETDYARRSAILLARYAEIFPSWEYEICRDEGCGLWTRWYHADFDTSMNLALAFDLLPDSAFVELGSSAQDDVRNLLVAIVQADLRYPMYANNWAFFRPLGLVVFGRVLNDPELVHLGYWFLTKLLHEYYTRDGFSVEGTYSYHAQITDRMLMPRQAFYLNGYSDPPGYVHEPFDSRWDPIRIDDFDLDAVHGDALRRMKSSLYDTALPNGWWPILNDTKHYDAPRAKPAKASLLLGGIGHAILALGTGARQTQARLDFSHTVSHRHRDALHLIFFGDKMEVVGGTAYRLPDRKWNTSTLSHNLVVVNGAEQKGQYFDDWTSAPYIPGIGRKKAKTRRQRWREDRENVHNDVLLWEPGYRDFDSVQVVEVDASDAYGDRVDRYQRMLAMVEIEEDDVYLVDLFRVRGGKRYDWLLHGGHGSNTLSTSLQMEPARGNFGQIQFQRRAMTSEAWEASFDHGKATGRILMSGHPDTIVVHGKGPRYEHGGMQDHLIARRRSHPDEEVAFLAVHETFTRAGAVKAIERLDFEGDPGSAIGLKISLADGTQDVVIHTLDDGPDFPEHRPVGLGIQVRGRFAHLRMRAGNVEWMYLVQGSELGAGQDLLSAGAGEYSHRGTVDRVERRESGSPENAFLVDQSLPSDGSLDGKTLLVGWGNGWTWAYRIKRVAGNRIVTSDEPGFELKQGKIFSAYFPLEDFFGLTSFPGPATFLIPGTALRDRAGRTMDTRIQTSAPTAP